MLCNIISQKPKKIHLLLRSSRRLEEIKLTRDYQYKARLVGKYKAKILDREKMNKETSSISNQE